MIAKHLYIPLCSLLLTSSVLANDIKQVRNSDGVVEFTNADIDVRKPTSINSNKTIIYKSLSNDGESFSFSDQRPINGEFEVLAYDCYACNPTSKINWHTISLNTSDYADTVKTMAGKYKVDAALVRAVIHAESAFNAKALSKKGAQGLMQLMPGTAKDLGVTNAFDVQQNIEGGVKYLSGLLDTFNGDIKLATAAYNAGPGAVKRYKGIPPFAETEVYVERVGILHHRYGQEG
ncbi:MULTISPECIES: lytic transglycosylase domain-containing protein [unclassified Methylophaga]|jgi:soluble lytic murein transglycosylase-like protein|uniref:lytic transglycosylase domain-containing protein n=1 Tax=unclassified Methylophaga TaxID=2629249 RepID=UPI0025DBEDD9|nr:MULTISPECIES: lytic transglycosylase domain-containing protein [unclassified Methylophaga]|tara:strand:- start:32737 stop:33438 length:702 start_codon:yes stop_codon:yes gene_type:complete